MLNKIAVFTFLLLASSLLLAHPPVTVEELDAAPSVVDGTMFWTDRDSGGSVFVTEKVTALQIQTYMLAISGRLIEHATDCTLATATSPAACYNRTSGKFAYCNLAAGGVCDTVGEWALEPDDDDPESINLETASMATGVADDETPVGSAANTLTYIALPDSDGATQKLQYDVATNTYSAGTDDDVPDAGEVDDSALAAGAVDGGNAGEIADNTVTADDLAANAVGNSEMGDDAIGAAEMADGDHGHVAWVSGVAEVEGIQDGTAFPGSPATGDVFVVTDDSAVGECDSAAGSAKTFCRWSGSAWEALGDGGESGGGTEGFVARLVADQSVAVNTTWTTLNMDTEDLDEGSDFNLTTDTYTAPSTGWYTFTGMTLSAATESQFLGIGINGADPSFATGGHGGMMTQNSAAGGGWQRESWTVHLSAGDAVDLQVWITTQPMSVTDAVFVGVELGGDAGSGTVSEASFVAEATTDQALTITTWTKVLLETETVDGGGDFDLTTEEFTVPTTGMYVFDCRVSLTTNGSRVVMGLGLNGSSPSGLELDTTYYIEIEDVRAGGTFVRHYTAGDEVSCWVLTASSSKTVDEARFSGAGPLEIEGGGDVAVHKNGTLVGTRPNVNLIEGSNITLTVTDDGGDNEVDVTIASSGGGGFPREFVFSAAGLSPLEHAADSIAPLGKDSGTNVDVQVRSFDAATDECVGGVLGVPQDIDSSGTITFRVAWYSMTATTNEVKWDIRHTGGQAEGVTWDTALTTEAAAADTTQGTVDQITHTSWTETVTNAAWAAGDAVNFELCRDANHADDDMAGDAELLYLVIEVPLA